MTATLKPQKRTRLRPPRSATTPKPEAPLDPTTAETDTLLIELEADLNADGSFGKRQFEVARHEIRVREADNVVSAHVPMSDIKSARHESLIGGGRLEVTLHSGQVVPLVAYSLTRAPKFSEAARGIEQLVAGEPLEINLKQEKTRCENCGRLLPEPDGVCPACFNRNHTLKRVANYLRPYRASAAALASLSLLTTALNLTPPWIQGTLINRVLQPQTNTGLLFALMGVWLGVVLCNVILQVVTARLTTKLASHIAADLRSDVYRAIEHLQLAYYDKKQVGALTSRVTSDTERVWGFLAEGMPFLISNSLLVLGIAVFLFLTNPILALCVLTPVPLVVFIGGAFWGRMGQLFHRHGQRVARFHTYLNETLSGMRVVKAFAQEDLENVKFGRHNDGMREAGARADNYWNSVFGLMSLCIASGTLLNWTVGGYFVATGRMTLGDFWKISAYLTLIYGPMQWFAQVNNWFSRAMAGAERIFEIVDAPKERYSKETQHREFTGEVEFQDVRFGYDKSNPVLKKLSFKASPGEFIGLVGKSGAGKSTTINLICRFYEPDVGTLLFDGVDYRELDLQDMRRQIGIVLQEPFLFNGSIAENISYGKPGATFEEIVEAAKAANAHGFILSKSDGYDTLVGERGAKLSGGERQRVSIARAILHDPKILILDEATASVDVETEKQIQGAMARLVAGRTTFAIAHRLATLRNATRLIVLDKGEIVEQGTHAELMAKEGEFYKLVKTQSEINEIIGVTE